jgi:crotonobetainyl-CoA:carnitine CoA-transferase CaiB-like acyl-CoA transferase
MIVEVDQPISGRVKLSGSVYKMSRTPGDRQMRVPAVGEHNEEIYGELLGIGAEEMKKLKEESVV